MQIVFQNKRDDLVHLYHYVVKETEDGKKLSRQVFQNQLMRQILVSALIGFVFTESFWEGIGLAVVIFVAAGFVGLLSVDAL